MKVIEVTASRSYTLKIPLLDYKGNEERFRPHEDMHVHVSFRAEVADEDVQQAARQLQDMAEGEVAVAVAVARDRARRAWNAAMNPERSDVGARIDAYAARLAQNMPPPLVQAPTDALVAAQPGAVPAKASLRQRSRIGELAAALGRTVPAPNTAAEADALINLLETEAAARKVPAAPTPQGAVQAALKCAACGVPIEERVRAYSVQHFKRPLCRIDQEKQRATRT